MLFRHNKPEIDALARRLIDPSAPQTIADLRGKMFAAQKALDVAQRIRSGTPTAEHIASHKAAQGAFNQARGEWERAQHEAMRAADAAIPELGRIIDDLAAAATLVAERMREVNSHVKATAGREHAAWRRWPDVEASGRGLAALAAWLRGPNA